MENHIAISNTLLWIVRSLDTPQISALAKALHFTSKKRLECHIEIHDAVLVHLIKQH